MSTSHPGLRPWALRSGPAPEDAADPLSNPAASRPGQSLPSWVGAAEPGQTWLRPSGRGPGGGARRPLPRPCSAHRPVAQGEGRGDGGRCNRAALGSAPRILVPARASELAVQSAVSTGSARSTSRAGTPAAGPGESV